MAARGIEVSAGVAGVPGCAELPHHAIAAAAASCVSEADFQQRLAAGSRPQPSSTRGQRDRAVAPIPTSSPPAPSASTRASCSSARYPPNVRGLKSSWFVMLALLPVALITYSPWLSAYPSAASSAYRYATAP